MRLFSTVISGNCHQAVEAINNLGLARFVIAIDCNSTNNTNVVLRSEDYSQGCFIIERLRREPMTPEQYFKGALR
jgi:hypothetical protein